MPTAISQLKSEPTTNQTQEFLSSYLSQCLRDKSYSPKDLKELLDNPQFSSFFLSKSLRITPTQNQALQTAVHSAFQKITQEKNISPPLPTFIEPYFGSPNQNVLIDQSIAQSTNAKEGANYYLRNIDRIGATTAFGIYPQEQNLPLKIYQTPIAIIGTGINGVMTARTLIQLGWNPDVITLFDKSGKYGGIWNFDFVAGLSRNNPRDLSFLGQTLPRAPGSGEEISNFIHQLHTEYFHLLPEPKRAIVTQISPGNLEHKIIFKEKNKQIEQTFPIIILAPGIGKPLPLSNPEKMTTLTPLTQAGYRWQQVITPEKANEYRNKTLIFIGLGNSTGEMLVQIQQWNQRGYNIDYRILTHYPQKSLQYPNDIFTTKNQTYRLFRDIKTPNLVDYAGDLPELNYVYFSALKEKKIISDVVNWQRKENTLHLINHQGKTEKLAFDQLFTLIGYGHSPDELHQFGLTLNPQTNSVLYDYDGEFQRPNPHGLSRLYKGYFGIGPILNCPENPNAFVIPGTMYRLNDLLCGIVLHSYEYTIGKK